MERYLADALSSPTPPVRRAAAHALGELKAEGTVPNLIEALGDSDGDTRSNAAASLGKLGDPRAVDGLIDVLGDPDAGTRASSAAALGKLGDPRAVDGLIDALGDPDDATRANAACSLAELGDARAVPARVDTLIDSSDEVRAASARALGKLGDERAVPALMGALGDSDSSIRETSAHALGTIGDPRAAPQLIGSLKDPEIGVRRAAVASLLKLDLDEHREEAVTALIEVMGDSRYSEDVYSLRAEAADALGELGDRRAVPVLIEALGERYKDEVVRSAARALGDIGDREAVPALVRVLKARLDRFSVDVVEALGKLGDPRAGQALIDTLDRYRYHDSRHTSRVISSTAEALGRLGVVRAIPHLLAQLHQGHRREVVAVTGALKQLGDTLAVEVTIDLLESAGYDYSERERATQVLGALEDPHAVPPLIRALEEEGPVVRVSAARALGRLRDLRAFEAPRQPTGR